MEDQEYASFDEKEVEEALSLAADYQAENNVSASAGTLALTADDGSLSIATQCISVTVRNRRVCLRLPLGIGNVCLPVPSFIPNGRVAQACLRICTRFGIPCGVQVTVSVAGQVIVRKGFGCSC
jgi:hypothetical protein